MKKNKNAPVSRVDKNCENGKQRYRAKDYMMYLICYTVLFFVASVIIFYPFLQEENCLIWKIDGVPQYMLWLQYTGEYLRDMIKQLFHGQFHLKLYDFSIGMGGDIRSFVKMEPIGFLSIFMTKGVSTWQAYSLLTLLRIYLIGLSFSCYGFYKKCSRTQVMAGSFIYAFSMYTFFQVVRHPQFAVPVILLPLLLIGLEQVMKKQNTLFFTLMVAVSLLSSYYFLYMNTIIMGCYVLIRIPEIYDRDRIRNFFQVLGRIIVSYIFGCLMTIVTFIPSIAGFFLSARSGGSEGSSVALNLLSYGKMRLPALFRSLISPMQSAGALTTITVAVIVIPAIASLCTRKWKEKRSTKIALILGILFLSFPIFGYIFSGFSAVNNRWCYAFVFLMAVIVMFELERMTHMGKLAYVVGLIFTAGYGACWICFYPEKKMMGVSWFLLVAVMVLLGVLKLIPKCSKQIGMAMLCVVTVLSVSVNGWYTFSATKGGLVNEFQSRHTADGYFTSSRYQYLTDIEDDSFYRTDTDMMYNNYNNTSVALDYNGISLYNSTIGKNTIEYFTESESVGISAINRTLSMDNRTSQEALACVKYFITTKNNSQNVPYGFEKNEELSSANESYDIYENEYILPIRYTYDTVITESDYDALPALEKQEVSMERAVLAEEDLDKMGNTLPNVKGESGDVSQGSIVITGVDEGIEETSPQVYHTNKKMKEETKIVDGREVTVDVSPKIHFQTKSKAGCEVYLRLKGLTFDRDVRTDFNVYIDGVDKRAIVRSDQDTYGLGMTDYLVNLGYFENEETIEGTFSLANKGTFSVDGYEVYYVSMEDYPEEIEALKEDSLDNVSVEDGRVEGDIQLDEDRYLAFSIPYHIGWKAYVDGKEVELYRTNTMYMGLPLTKGTHTILLEYTSPGLSVGFVVSGLSILLFLVLVFRWMWNRKRKNHR